MGVLRIEPARAQAWTARSLAALWRTYDLQLTIYALLLGALGLAMAYSNSVESGTAVMSPGSTFVRGLMWAGLAIIVFAAATAFDYSWFRTFAWPLYFVNLALLAISLVIGDGVGGVARWVTVGPFQVQFSEIAKILMIIVLAHYLAGRQQRLNGPIQILGACLLVAPPTALVLLQPDLGTSLVFIAILGGMLFLTGASLRWLGVLTAVAIAVVPIAWTYVLKDYQKQRLISFLYPQADPQGSGYQLLQSQISVGSGGWAGKGLTNGTQDRGNFLPVQTTDFVFAKLGEELGFIGAIVVFVLFAALIWRILVAGWRARDPFGLAMAAGLASMVFFQFVINVGMVIGVMPITGIPLPFITHGGASLISLAFGLGILQSMNIRQSRAEW